MIFGKEKNRKPEAAPDNAGGDLMTLRLAIAEVMAESWHFERALAKVLQNMDAMEAERFGRQYRYFTDRVGRAAASAGLTCLDFTGQPYDVGMAVQAMNLDEFEDDEPLIITQMIEPVIMCDGQLLKVGMVMLGQMRGTG